MPGPASVAGVERRSLWPFGSVDVPGMNRFAVGLTLALLASGCRVETPSWQLPQGYSDTYRKALHARPAEPMFEFDTVGPTGPWLPAAPTRPPAVDPQTLPAEIDLQTLPREVDLQTPPPEPAAASRPFIPAPHLNLPTPARIDGPDLPPSP